MSLRLALLLSASLLLNFVWIGGRIASSSAAPGTGASVEPSAGQSTPDGGGVEHDTVSSVVAVRPGSAAPDRSVREQAQAVRTLLREAGVEESVVRTLVTQLIQMRYAQTQVSPWWQGSSMGSSLRLVPADRQKEMDAMVNALFGRVPSAPLSSILRQVPADKAAAVTAILSDYSELQRNAYIDMRDFQMPEDQQRLEFLGQEMRKDLRALLTDEEYAKVEAEWSPAGNRAKMVAGMLGLDEAEFWAVYAERRELDAAVAAGTSSQDSEARFDTWLAETFGQERLDQAALRNSRDYALLQTARQRLGFSQETFDGVLALRDHALVVSREVLAMQAGVAEKKAALKTAAVDIRAELVTLLGNAVAQSYLRQNGMGWIDDMERGKTVRFVPNGHAETTWLK